MLHVDMVEDSQGDLIDILYYCSYLCASLAGLGESSAWPGGMETDYPKYCTTCGDRID